MSAASTSGAGKHSAAYFRLRSDLRVTADVDGAFIVEDPVRTQFFRMGPSEYRLISYLDGKTSLKDACERASREGTTASVPDTRLDSLAQWLLASNLVVAPVAGSASAPRRLTGPPHSTFATFAFR